MHLSIVYKENEINQYLNNPNKTKNKNQRKFPTLSVLSLALRFFNYTKIIKLNNKKLMELESKIMKNKTRNSEKRMFFEIINYIPSLFFLKKYLVVIALTFLFI